MPKVPFFSGDFWTVDDQGAESVQLINLFPEVIDSGSGKAVGRLVGTPGLQLFADVGEGPIRALWMGEGRMFTVSGPIVYEVFGDAVAEVVGDVGDDEEHTPATILPNGNELLVLSAGWAYRIWNETLEDDTVVTHTDKVRLIAAEYTDLALAVMAFLYDLEIDPDDNTRVGSAARPFKPEDVALNLRIREGIDFTPATYTIFSVDVDGIATLDAPCGVAGAVGGVGEIIDSARTDWVTSPTLPFVESDIGDTLIIDADSPAEWGGGGTYHIIDVGAPGTPEEGMAQLDTGAGTAGALNGKAVQYPHESQYTDADGYLKAGTGCFLDGYGIIAPPPAPATLTNRFYISENVNNGFGYAKWHALDFGTKEAFPDNILTLIADHEQLVIFGDLESAEVWHNTGAANFPIERDMGAFMHYGIAAQHSATRLGLNGIAWLGWSAGRGAPQAYYAQGFQPQRISTPMLEHLWDQYPSVRDAIAYNYVEDGHHFYQITFPSADITWCYDLTASQQIGKPMWHARATGLGPLGSLGSGPSVPENGWHRVRANCHTYGYFAENEDHAGGTWGRDLTHFVGDWEDGRIYVQGLYNFDYAGEPIRRMMQTVHLANENKKTIWNLFQLECKVGLNPDENLVWALDLSRDRGTTFINERVRVAYGTGPTNQRLRWWRCGQSYDQVWRLTTFSPVKISITSAWFDATECEH